MKKVLIGLLLIIAFLIPTEVLAVEDPTLVVNNRFGIHVVDEGDLNKAAELVNSNGGEWGYVTVVIQQDDRIVQKWQKIFDRMRELKLIPIVRLATKVENGVWIKPKEEEVRSWADFLNALNWVVKNRYVVFYNEPNHAKEWGGQVRPDEYAKMTRALMKQLKEFNNDYFVLPAGLDLAADNSLGTKTAVSFWQGIYNTDSDLLKDFDGLTSHSYPNPAFSGKPTDVGQKSIRGYQWEISYLKRYGVRSDVPVFITETGWEHKEGKMDGKYKLTADQVADYYKSAFEGAWNNDQVVAVTPFILNYQDDPFDHFSWTKYQSGEMYPQFEVVKDLPKLTGKPVQIAQADYIPRYFPSSFAVDGQYQVAVRFLNTGQAIWYEDDTEVRVSASNGSEVQAERVETVPPGYVAKVWLKINTPPIEGEETLRISLWRNGSRISPEITKMVLIKPNSVMLQLKMWFDKVIHRGDLLGVMWKGYWKLAQVWV